MPTSTVPEEIWCQYSANLNASILEKAHKCRLPRRAENRKSAALRSDWLLKSAELASFSNLIFEPGLKPIISEHFQELP